MTIITQSVNWPQSPRVLNCIRGTYWLFKSNKVHTTELKPKVKKVPERVAHSYYKVIIGPMVSTNLWACTEELAKPVIAPTWYYRWGFLRSTLTNTNQIGKTATLISRILSASPCLCILTAICLLLSRWTAFRLITLTRSLTVILTF
jgi:hypothetical protein